MNKRIITILFIVFTCFTFSQTVVINELDSDNSGFDTTEFIELKSFDAGGSALANFSLNGYTIVFYNEGTVASYYAIDLDGLTTDINGIIHIGNSAVSPAPVTTFPNSTIQNGPDVVALYQANSSDFPLATAPTTTGLVHSLAYNTGTAQPTNLMSALGTTIFVNENANNAKDTQSIQRKNDGTYEVKNPTPGANNDGSGVVFNEITISLDQENYNEGDQFYVTFTTSQPVTGSNLAINFSIANGNFMVNDYNIPLTDLTPVIYVGQTSAQALIVLNDDSVDEGDEEMLIDVQSLPSGYVVNNDNIIVRIYDNDYSTDPWGTPLNPTYGLCTPQIPTGYYDSLNGLSGAALKQATQDIIANSSVVRLQSYADIWDILKEADRNPENNNQVWTIYREMPMAKLDQQNTSSIIGKWNREHIFCQSRGGFEVANSDTADGINVWSYIGGPAATVEGVSDAHHIRAVNGQENSSRNNKNYGETATSTIYAGPTGTQGSWKGDVARALFYMAVRFNDLDIVNGDPSENNGSDPSYQIGDLATLLNWNTQDPSDDFEMNRNNVVYNWQMNRNPFIDMPLLADYIFGSHYGDVWNATLTTPIVSLNTIKVYPNPAVDYIYINGLEGIAQAEIFTLTGQKVLEIAFENETKISFDLQAGVYLVKITNGTNELMKKIVIQ
ncbi:endonuclease [Flavobacterium sp.]|uniref:endonuclease n=1 Tax=Flavobacterium sp. TaxID=239 RepID=UPI0035278890